MTRPNIGKVVIKHFEERVRMNNAAVESVKEFIRMIATAVVSFLLVDNAVNFILVWMVGDQLSPEQVLFVSALLTVVLKSVDKFVHKSGNETPLDLKMLDELKK